MKRIAFTGHRPKDLGGKTYLDFRAALDALGVGERRDLHFIVGGALGVDTWAAEYALSHKIPYTMITPFTSEVMGRFWPQLDRDLLAMYADRAAEYRVITTGPYDVGAYQQRNEAMVDTADVVFAVWTGKTMGGTANCIRYAQRMDKPIYNLWPLDGKLRLIKR
jgi:uncharacterized phage-like protein YoqJ